MSLHEAVFNHALLLLQLRWALQDAGLLDTPMAPESGGAAYSQTLAE
jgi:hypothetical protein